MHCLSSGGQWAMEIVQWWALQLLKCTDSLPWGSEQCTSCNAQPHRPGAMGSETRAIVGSATREMQCLTAWGQSVVELVQ